MKAAQRRGLSYTCTVSACYKRSCILNFSASVTVGMISLFVGESRGMLTPSSVVAGASSSVWHVVLLYGLPATLLLALAPPALILPPRVRRAAVVSPSDLMVIDAFSAKVSMWRKSRGRSPWCTACSGCVAMKREAVSPLSDLRLAPPGPATADREKKVVARW